MNNPNHGGLFAPGGPQLESHIEPTRTFGAKVVDLGIEFSDPRPDLDRLYHDGGLWAQLLAISHRKDPILSGTLHGFRCQGTKLEKGSGGYVIRPVIGDAAWPDQRAYDRDRERYLIPHRARLTELLDELIDW